MEMMEAATKGDQKALGALDNIAVKFGTENFAALTDIISRLGEVVALPTDMKDTLASQLDQIKSHVKYNLVHHLKEHSPCAAHCYCHLLSNPSDAKQSSTCPPTCDGHPQHCPECDEHHVFFVSLEALVQKGQEEGVLSHQQTVDFKFEVQ